MDEKKAIVFVLDDGYADKALPAILDVWGFSGKKYPVYIMHGGNLSQNPKFKIRKLADAHGIDLRFYDVSAKGELLKDLTTHNHVSIIAYAKLLLGDLLWEGINFAYYFDADILVLRDLTELFAIEPEKAIAVVDHREPKHHLRLHGTEGRYINTGIIVANLPRWNSINAVEMFKEAIRTHSDRFKYNDQDVFAVAFDDENEELPIEYNFMMSTRANPYIEDCGDKDWDPKKIDPAILHFVGPTKPWGANSHGKSHKMWRKRNSFI